MVTVKSTIYAVKPDESACTSSMSVPIESEYDCGPAGNYPLVQAAGTLKYKPYSLGDVQALVDKLPPLTEGGSKWLNAVDKYTKGSALAVGNMRALLGRCVTTTRMCEIERAANWGRKVADSESLNMHVASLSFALRETYPLPEGSGVPKFKWEPGQNPTNYIDMCKQEWFDRTSCNGQNKEQRHFFRKAVLDGVPQSVVKAMGANPDIPGAEADRWERHLIHHLQEATDEANKNKTELEDMQTQLLKLQLKQVRDEVQTKNKNSKQMVVAVPLVQAEAPRPVPPEQPPPFQPSYPQRPIRGQWNRGGFARGRGASRGNQPRGPRPGDVCHWCQQPGHWARTCRERLSQMRESGFPPTYPASGAPYHEMYTGQSDWTSHSPESSYQQ